MERSMLSKPEYYDKNNIVTLILRNKISSHEGVISEPIMKMVEQIWLKLNQTEKIILLYFFENHQTTSENLSLAIKKTNKITRDYLNKFVSIGILDRNSKKIRDKEAIYSFKRN
jgi:predicted HTH transcriptional regulator